MLLTQNPPDDGVLSLELYVAGDSLNSRRAIVHFEAIVKLLGKPATVTVVDVLIDKKAAFARRIFATPSLVSTIDGRESLIIGDLSDSSAVIQKLRG